MKLACRFAPLLLALLAPGVLASCATPTPPAPPGPFPRTTSIITTEGFGLPQPGTMGRDAEASALVAALVHAAGLLADVLGNTRFTPERVTPPVEFLQARTRYTSPGGAQVFRAVSVYRYMLVDDVIVLTLPADPRTARAPITLVAKEHVLVAPAITEIDVSEVQSALERAGLGTLVKASPGADGTRVTLATPTR